MSSGWVETTIGEVAEIVSGATPKTGVAELWDGGIPWATPKDLSELGGRHEISRTPRTISEAGLRSCAASLLPVGSVLLSSRAPIGHVAINTVPMATNQGFKSLVPNSKRLDPKFLYWWLRRNRPMLESIGNGATFKEISKKSTAAVPISLPPIKEQRRIAGVLDVADALRTKRRQALAKLGTLSGSMVSAYLSVYPERSLLGDHLTFVTSGSRGWAKHYSETGSRFIRSQDVLLGSIDQTDPVFVTPPNNSESKRTVIRAGDLLVTITGVVGRVTAAPPELHGAYISQHVSIARPAETLRPRFAEAFMCSHDGQSQLARAQYGQTKPGLNLTQIREFKLPVPSLDVQDALVSRLNRLDAQRATHCQSERWLDDLFASLQQRAFRGEL